MSWENDYREDGLWTLVDEALGTLDEYIREDDLDTSDSRVQRLRSILSHLIAYREHPDVLITPAARRNVGNAVGEIVSKLPNIESLFKAPAGGSVSKFEELARAMRSWPQRGSISLAGLKQQIQQLNEALDTAKESASQRVREVEEHGNSASDEIKKQYQTHLEELQVEMNELQKEIADLRNGTGVVNDSLAQAEVKIEESLKSQKLEFEADQETRTETFNEQLLGEVKASQNERESAKSEAKNLLKEITEKKTEADELLGALAQRSTAKDYGQWAEQQRNSAKWWSWTAVALFVLAAIAFMESTFHFFTSPTVIAGADSLWGDAFTRLGMTGVVLAGALYAAKESGQHKKEERKAKARELVLTTMDPFMVNIDEDVKELIRTEAARAIFVLRDEGESQGDQPPAFDRLWEIINSRTRKGEEE